MPGDLTIENANIWTADAAHTFARSVRVEAGRIVSIDQPGVASGTILNARGRTIIPGLIDGHMHLLLGGETLTRLDLSEVTSREQFEAAIAAADANLRPDQWLLAGGWSDANLAEDGPPDHTWLTQAGDRPVVAYRSDLHAALVNRPVMAMLDLATDPPGGRAIRDAATGEPTGLLIEAAAWQLVNPLVPRADAHTKREALHAAQQHCHALGLTAVGTMEYQRDVEAVFLPMRESLTLRCAVTLLDREWPVDVSFGCAFPNDASLAVIGYKAFVDGTFGSRSARMFEPYADDPENRGLLVELALNGHLDAWAKLVAAAGLSPSMHAIGDEAVHLALNAADQLPATIRCRIEHAQQVSPSDFARFAGRVASMQPLHKADDGRIARSRLGDERLPGCYAFRSLLNAGAHLAFGSDWPVVSCDPIAGVHAAVTGLTLDGAAFLPEQNLTVHEALLAYTAGAADALGQSHIGRLKPGCCADMVVLDRDPFTCDWAAERPAVCMTIVDGKVVWQAAECALRLEQHDRTKTHTS